jgi:hypothetical protein
MFVEECGATMGTHASERGEQRLMDILDIYQRGSGQRVNMTKSAIFFSENCGDSDKEVVKQVMVFRMKP